MIVAFVVAACGPASTSPSPSPGGASPSPFPSPSPSASPATSPSPSAAVDPFVGQLVKTVSDGLRVRSEPRVADDSIKYEPLLPIGTELRVLDGPVMASGYTWYKVQPIAFKGLKGPGYGWVAMASTKGEPWIALVDAPIAGITLASSKVARAVADPAAAKAMAASLDAFGIALYRAMFADPLLDLKAKNAVYSPASVALAVAMARAGARGTTAAEIDSALHVKGWDQLGEGLNSLSKELAGLDASWKDYDGTAHVLALNIANAGFGQQDWPIEPAFLDALARDFGAGLRLVDYRRDPEAARKLINAWVSQQTKDRIPELLSPGTVTELTRLALVNAIYLKANWSLEFRKGDTKTATFSRLDGSRVSVPTMSLLGGAVVPYATGSGWKATELRYLGASGTTPLAMTLILPDNLGRFEQSLSADTFASIVSSLDAQRDLLTKWTVIPGSEMGCSQYAYEVNLYMPRFSAGTTGSLIPALKALGIADAFDPDLADLTGTSPERPLYIGAVIHQANIDVDEKGTEAAAATAVLDTTTGGCGPAQPAKTVTLRLDHPFLFAIRDVRTGAILFMGRVADPSIQR